MKYNPNWNARPFRPLDCLVEAENPFVCRLAPAETSFTFDLLDNGAPESTHVVYIRKKGSEDTWRVENMPEMTLTVTDLTSDCDYEFYVARKDDESARSGLRFVRTGFYPDTMVHYNHPEDPVYAFSGQFLCDPTFVRVPSGALVAAMDVFVGAGPQTMEILFRSEDNGVTWKYVCDLVPAYWGTLFMHKGVLYMLCTTTENGNLQIGASYDEGYTWTRPVTLFIGGNTHRTAGFQRQPMPINVFDGKIMTSLEFGGWFSSRLYGIGILSAPEDADLLDPASWSLSDFTYYDMNWEGSPVGGNITFLEGSIYRAADGKLINLLRMQINNSVPNHGKACLLEVDPENLEAAPKFHSIIDMPTGANSRTHILKDPVGGKYWGIGNEVIDSAKPWMRNIMTLVVSDDGYNWRVAKRILDYSHLDHEKVGFQYTSFIFDGDDILYLSRTAFNGASNFHDANCQTFGVVKNFRELG